MGEKQATVKQASLPAIPGVKFSSVGLTLPKKLDIETWQSIGEFMRRADTGIQWWVGDWARHGEHKWGDRYKAIIEATGFDYQTIANEKWVAGVFKQISLRREKLTWHHHKILAFLTSPEERKAWLDKAEAEGWSARQLRKAIQAAYAKKPPPLPKGKYDVLLADPPWQYDFSETDSRQIEKHYPTMTIEDIAKLEIVKLAADDAVLFLWATAPKLCEALDVMEAWDFTYTTHAVWDKEKLGMGYWFRGQHELLLVGTRGKYSPPEEGARIASVIRIPRKQHSTKPRELYAVIENMLPDARRRVELFARHKQTGWTAWGDEMEECMG